MQQLRKVHSEDMFGVNGKLSFGAIKVSSPHPGKHLIKFKYNFCIIIDNYWGGFTKLSIVSDKIVIWYLKSFEFYQRLLGILVFVILRMIHVNKNFLFVLCKIASGNSLFGIGTDLNWIAKNIFIVA